MIRRAVAGETVAINDDVVLLSSERFDELEGELALIRFEADRAAGGRQHGIPHHEVRRTLGL